MLQVNVNRCSYKCNVRIYKISEDRYNEVIIITMHVLIIFRSSCLIYLGMFILTNMGIAVFVTCNHLKRSSND